MHGARCAGTWVILRPCSATRMTHVLWRGRVIWNVALARSYNDVNLRDTLGDERARWIRAAGHAWRGSRVSRDRLCSQGVSPSSRPGGL